MLIVPAMPEIVMVLGYGEAEALSTNVMVAPFVLDCMVSVVPPSVNSNTAVPKSRPLSSSASVAVKTPPHSPVAAKVKELVTGAPLASKAPKLCGPSGETTPPVASSVAITFVVSAEPALRSTKSTVTVSSGSMAPLPVTPQLSATKAAPSPITTGICTSAKL